MSATSPALSATPGHRSDRLDPVVFEILKHRLWQINDEQGTALKRVSGSPVATEVQDFNVGIADAEGRLVAAGMYLLAHVTGLSQVIANCIATVGRDRIRPGDMFVTNDPWMGAVHQNDVAVVSPLHRDGELVGWTGSVIHQSDVGGPVPGSWNLAASDTFQEAPRYRFLRLVDGGIISREVLATLTTNSRLPQLVELDMRAQIAAATVARSRMDELYERYGVATIQAVMARCLETTESMLRRRLDEVPDGEVHAQSHVDHDGHTDTLTTIRLRLTKAGQRLVFDFSDSDPQAAGLINCTRSTLMSAPFSAVLTFMCGGIPWNEGVLGCIELVSHPGTVVDCTFPAPVASGIVNAGWAALNACCSALGRLLIQSPQHRERAMAVWAGAPFGVNIFGETAEGKKFGTLLGLSGLQGAGARVFADGYDVAGYLHSPRSSAMNVEVAEANYPILHLHRERGCDTGGPGLFRGGTGIRMAVVPYGASALEMVLTAFGADQSGSEGLAGGLPGGGVHCVIVHDSDATVNLAARATGDLTSSSGSSAEVTTAKAHLQIASDDVILMTTHGGGGYGDPLRREPLQVTQDVADGAVSAEWAKRAYGVVLGDDGGCDYTATEALRDQMRAARLASAEIASDVSPELLPMAASAGLESTRCPHCRHDLANAVFATCTAPLGAAGPHLAAGHDGDSPRFRLRSILCPQCGTSLDLFQERLSAQESRA